MEFLKVIIKDELTVPVERRHTQSSIVNIVSHIGPFYVDRLDIIVAPVEAAAGLPIVNGITAAVTRGISEDAVVGGISGIDEVAAAEHLQLLARVDDGDGEWASQDVVAGPLDLQNVLADLRRVVLAQDGAVATRVRCHLHAERTWNSSGS